MIFFILNKLFLACTERISDGVIGIFEIIGTFGKFGIKILSCC